MPKTIDEMKYFSDDSASNVNEKKDKQTLKLLINGLCSNLLDANKNRLQDKEVHYRIDGVVYNPTNKQLLIITDKYLYDFRYDNGNFTEKNKILIRHIDYVTLTRDNKLMILHLVEESNQPNYTIHNRSLDRVVGCLSSTFFYDKHDYSYNKEKRVTRKIPVILMNPNMKDLIATLEKSQDFSIYRDAFNNYLDKKLNKIKLSKDYVYTSLYYKEAAETNFKLGDLIIDTHAYYLLSFENNEYELQIRVYLKNITKMKCKDNTHSVIIHDDVIYPDGLEIKTDNYLAMHDLISKNIKNYNSKA